MEGGVTPFSSSMAPSGSYILVVVSQPLTEEHKKIILERLNKGLLSWDVSSTGCDLSGLEHPFDSIIKERLYEGDVLIQHSTESLGVEVLLSPTVRTLKQCVKNLLSTSTSHKQLVFAGYTFAGSGSWILENGTFSFAEFLEIFQESKVQNQKRCTVNVHCAEEGEWNKTNFAKDIFTKAADVALNPPEKVNHVPGSEHLLKCLENALVSHTLEEVMKPSPLVGNIRFNRPTIYMFPAGQGDCALFGINGFNMLIDGGFHRKPCSWEFVRHLDRLDAVLVTRIGESNICGVSTLMKRNALNNANPQIGYVFCNILDNKPTLNGHTEKKDDLIVSVVGEGHNFVQTLNDLNLKPHQCWRDSSIDPFVLYHKVGQGTLEMHVLSPPRDSKEMKTFLSEWNSYKENFSGVKSELKNSQSAIPLSHATSICAILVWRPEDPKDTITRILFPGSTPQNKILEGLDKLKSLNILNQPVVTKTSLVNIPATKVISTKIEKSVNKVSIPNRNHTASPALSMSSVASKNGDIGGLKKDIKEVKKIVKEVKKDVKKEIKKEVKKDVSKEVKKTESLIKKDPLVKKEVVKEVKKVVKKDNKELKAVTDKKLDMKPKKEAVLKTPTPEAKKTTVVKKNSTPPKRDVGKPPIAPKATEVKKSLAKGSEPKISKDVSNKKTTEVKTVAKVKPKVSSVAPKTSTTPKTKPISVAKPGNKMTKAVAASSIVASVVAATAVAIELNEKKKEIEDIEPEISEKEVEENIEVEIKEDVKEGSLEELVSPLPPEALSPTPSESVSLTPSDTLSSAPLETVSPTPPLPNEPISTEEKDVNEIKDIEQDMPYEQETKVGDTEIPYLEKDLNQEDDAIDIEAQLAKHQAESDIMSRSFMGDNETDDVEVVENYAKTEIKENEAVLLVAGTNSVFAAENVDATEKAEIESAEGKYTEDKFIEKHFADENEIYEGKIAEKDIVDVEKEIAEGNNINIEKEITEESNKDIEKNICEEVIDEKESIVCGVPEDYIDEKDTVEEKETVQEKEMFDKDYNEKDIAEKDVAEEKDDAEDVKAVSDYHDKKPVSEDFENKHAYGENEKDIDDQLAGLSMEGSYCAGMEPTIDENVISTTKNENNQNDENKFDNYSNIGMHVEKHVVEEHVYGQKSSYETESYMNSQITKSEITSHNLSHEMEADKEDYEEKDQSEDLTDLTNLKHDYESYETSHNIEKASADQNKQSDYEIFKNDDDYEKKSTSVLDNKEENVGYQYGASHFDKLSQIQSMSDSFHQDAYDNYDNSPNLNDPEMQETSVDDPEDIVRRESAVSITLNDEKPEEQYNDNWRRKSGTESEDDVDIGKYMLKEQVVEEDKLHVQQETDSDEDDVVKSPTPHAVVDYEGQLDEVSYDIKEKNIDGIESEKSDYPTEKRDDDEKDRDSAEEPDTDDGEMIIHPTPPEYKYSEEEMRDPIGQHIIINPSLKQGTDIADQPLYEEAEEESDNSERSQSPIVEEPVFGSTAQVDFPELVTVSGGTTPSEPQSPKASFDAKKYAESSAMDALSEHDVSESSTHSPSCQEGSTAFDLQASEQSILEVQSLQEDKENSASGNDVNASEVILETCSKADTYHIEKVSEIASVESTLFEEKEDKEDKKETPSDEEESSSEDENSESHSKDKSDAMGDKSDVDHDDKSDIHNDDKSDHHNDGKSDAVHDNEHDNKSDIHDSEQLYRQQNSDVLHDSQNISPENIEPETHDNKDIPEEYTHQSTIQSDYENSSYTHKQVYSMKDDTSDFTQTFENKPKNLDEQSFDVVQDSPLNDNDGFDDQSTNYSKSTIDYQSISSHETYESNILPQSEAFDKKEPTAFSPDSHSDTVNVSDANIATNNSDKDDSVDAFRAGETYIENTEHISVHGFNSYDNENETKNPSVSTDSQNVEEAQYLQEVPSDFMNKNDYSYEQSGKELYEHQEGVYDDTTYQQDNIDYDNQPEMVNENHHDTLLQEEKGGIHNYNEMYSDSVTTKTVNSDLGEINFGFSDSPIKSFSSTNTYDYSTSLTTGNVNPEMDQFYKNEVYSSETALPDFKKAASDYQPENIPHTYSNDQYDYVTESYSHTESKFKELHNQSDGLIEITSVYDDLESLPKHGISSVAGDINFNEKEEINVSELRESSVVTSKEEISYAISTTEVTSEFINSEILHQETVTDGVHQIEQDSSYLIHNRFHSDSPEDNTMRSDSSPDVPYPADLTEKFSDANNSYGVNASETYIHTDDYQNNINFSNTEGLPPLSPKILTLNANQNNTYAESSEDESNAHVHGNVSPFAYTNKAYTREEEDDIDGNHIYKEETTEVIQEFDGNNLQTLTTTQSSVMNYSQEFQDTGANFRLEEWGKPMGLPTPPDASQKTVTKKTEKTTVKSKISVDTNGKAHSPSVSSKLSSPLKKPKPKTVKESSSSPVYVDLAYVPQHADPDYCDVEFFKKIRARYYVFSSVNPSKEVLNALLEAKKTWNEDLSVTIIPTYETDTLGYWMAQNRDDLTEYSIDVSPSASRCTVNLQDHQTSCSAYRLEF